MGQSRERVGRSGDLRYTAYYTDVTGRRRSAGTFRTERKADKAWQSAEAKVAEGRVTDLRRGRQQFRRYVEEVWFPNHQLELTSRQNYSYCLNKHILPEFGGYRLNEIQAGDVRAWVTKLQGDGVKPGTIKYCLSVMSAIFTTALNDQLTAQHPCTGVKAPTVASKTRRIVTPDQFDVIHRRMPTRDIQLLVETDIETGLRWGELVELRKRDIDWDTGVLTVSRVVVELTPKFHPEGKRFLIKQYPKDDEWREITLSRYMLDQLAAHAEGMVDDDLLFMAPQPSAPRRRRPDSRPSPGTLGLTEPNAAGKRYQHGTITAYSSGKCHCQHCRDAYAIYRAERRASGADKPRGLRMLDTDGHIPRAWFRRNVWTPALAAAGLRFKVRFHDLRHAHASWLLAGGADLQTVKERMGHARLTTTEKYLHTLPHADAAAVAALDTIRKRTP
jgi:site-specific recombinase XerD